MSRNPALALTNTDIKFRRLEPYTSASINTKFLGSINGIYRGFVPSTPGAYILSLARDPSASDSVAKVESYNDAGSLLVRLTSDFSMDFTGHTDWPVFVVIRAQHQTSPASGLVATIAKYETLFTIGGGAVVVDLATIATPTRLPLLPGSVTLTMTPNGGAPTAITDDGNGNITGATISGAGTVDYVTGAFTGTTVVLQGASDILITSDYASTGRTEIKVCEVTENPPGTGTLVITTTIPTSRHAPYAYTGTAFGFMPGGSIELLDSNTAAIAPTSAEVAAARSGLIAWPSLADRLDNEIAATGQYGIAGRLAYAGKMVAGARRSSGYKGWPRAVNGVPISTGNYREVNLSSDFAAVGPGGSDSQKGAVTDTPYNRIIVHDTNHNNFVDAEGNAVYGRLQYEAATSAGIARFRLGFTTVTGSGGMVFTATFEDGDLIAGPDGGYYVISTVDSASQITLRSAYASTTDGYITNPQRRRFLGLFYSYKNPGGETAYDFGSAVVFDYYSHQIFDLADKPTVSDVLLVRSHQAAGNIPDASTTVAGKVQYAANNQATALLAVQGNDDRLQGVRVRESITGSYTNRRPRINFVPGPNTLITITESGLPDDWISVEIAANMAGGAVTDAYANIAGDSGTASASGGDTFILAGGKNFYVKAEDATPDTAFIDWKGMSGYLAGPPSDVYDTWEITDLEFDPQVAITSGVYGVGGAPRCTFGHAFTDTPGTTPSLSNQVCCAYFYNQTVSNGVYCGDPGIATERVKIIQFTSALVELQNTSAAGSFLKSGMSYIILLGVEKD